MYFNCKGVAAFIIVLLGWVSSGQAQVVPSDRQPLVSQPTKCVALTQGRECFAQIVLTWKAAKDSDYCLVREMQDLRRIPLQCWEASASGKFVFDMQATQDVVILLLEKDGKEAIGRSVVQVSWLYQSNSRKRRWRLF